MGTTKYQQRQVYKNPSKTVKQTKVTNKKTGTSKILIESLRPKRKK